jgi:hypothetical protein
LRACCGTFSRSQRRYQHPSSQKLSHQHPQLHSLQLATLQARQQAADPSLRLLMLQPPCRLLGQQQVAMQQAQLT